MAERSGPRRWFGGLHAAVVRLRGWRRAGLAIALGALAVLALPPVYAVPVLVPAFSLLVWLLDGSRTWRGATWVGFLFGFGYFTAGLYWVANALLTKPEQFGLVAPLAPMGLALILAPFVAVACGLSRIASRPGVGRVLTLAAAWTLLEWVRSWAFTGFPWNLLGSVWAFSDAMLQVTSVVGTYGLSLMTIAAAALPATLPRPGLRRRLRWTSLAISYGLLLAVFAGGMVRLFEFGTIDNVPGVTLRLVQPNIPQNQKWKRDLAEAHVRMQADMGAWPPPKGDPEPTDVIWSEAAAPLFLARDPELLTYLSERTPKNGLTILGTLRASYSSVQPTDIWNSLLAIDDTGRIVGHYDKSHLVPFGEYMPLRSLLGLGSVAGGMTDLSSGPGRRTLRLPGLPPVGPLICYEVIFPGEVTDPNERPQWLLNITNDGWYGVSAGPHQHFVAARLRAVEEGLPVVRVANTGISGVIDPLGRVRSALPLGEQGILDAALPRSLDHPTLFAQLGVWLVLGVTLAVGALGVVIAANE